MWLQSGLFRGWTNQIRRHGVWSWKKLGFLSPIPTLRCHSHNLPFLGSSYSQTHFLGPSSIHPMRLMVFFRKPPCSIRLTPFPDVCVAERVLGLRVLSWFCSRHAPFFFTPLRTKKSCPTSHKRHNAPDSHLREPVIPQNLGVQHGLSLASTAVRKRQTTLLRIF